MREEGTVIKTNSLTALVEINCKGCESCGVKVFCGGRDKNVVKAENELKAKLGDKVIIEIPRKSFYISLSLIFVIPIIIMSVSFLILKPITGDLLAGFISLCLLVTWFIVLKIFDKKHRERVIPKIISIYDNNT